MASRSGWFCGFMVLFRGWVGNENARRGLEPGGRRGFGMMPEGWTLVTPDLEPHECGHRDQDHRP